jgi:glutathionyl-hydroquinone reductase
MWVGGQRHAPAALPPEKTRYLLYGRLGWPWARSGRVRKISLLTGFDPRSVQLVASR